MKKLSTETVELIMNENANDGIITSTVYLTSSVVKRYIETTVF